MLPPASAAIASLSSTQLSSMPLAGNEGRLESEERFSAKSCSRELILVTGASGFVGQHVCRHLAESGYQVRALVRHPWIQPHLETVVSPDLADTTALRHAMRGVKAVVHLAARVHVMAEEGPSALAEYRKVNVEGTRCVTQAAVDASVDRFIFISSVKAVGEASGDAIWNEATPAAPIDPYGISKLEAEQVVFRACSDRNTQPFVVRIPLVYGPGMGANMLRLFSTVRRGIPLPFGGIENRRSLLFVGNLTSAIAAIIERQGAPGVYFLSDGVDLSSADLVRGIAAGFGIAPRVFRIPAQLIRSAGRIGDAASRMIPWPLTSAQVHRLTSSLAVSPDRFFAEFNFSPPFSPQEALRITATEMSRAVSIS